MSRTTLLDHLAPLLMIPIASAWLAGFAPAGDRDRSTAVQGVIVADTKELFRVGFDEAEFFFGQVTDMVIGREGRILVYDRQPADADGRRLTVLSPDGEVVSRWGRPGDGPGELRGGRIALAVEGDTVVVAGTRSGFFSWSGRELSRRDTPLRLFFEIALVDGEVYAWRQEPDLEALARGDITEEMRFGPWDGDSIWHRRVLNSVMFSPLTARPLLAVVPGRRLVVGYGDEYLLQIIDSSSGNTVNTVTRSVPKRGESETVRFLELARHYLANPSEAPSDWSSLVGQFDSPRSGGIPEQLPMIRNVLWGPPGVLWVERGIGIADEFAGPLDHPDESRLWDLFELGDTMAVYRGTVSLPSEFRPHAGTRDRLAGLIHDDVGRQVVSVMEVDVPGVVLGR